MTRPVGDRKFIWIATWGIYFGLVEDLQWVSKDTNDPNMNTVSWDGTFRDANSSKKKGKKQWGQLYIITRLIEHDSGNRKFVRNFGANLEV